MAESAAQLGFWPDLISTDLHSGNVHGGTTMDLCFYIRCGLSASQVLCHCDFIIALRIHDLCNFFFLHSKRSINILNSIFSSRFSLDFNTDLCRRKKLDISCFYGQSVSKVFGTFPFWNGFSKYLSFLTRKSSLWPNSSRICKNSIHISLFNLHPEKWFDGYHINSTLFFSGWQKHLRFSRALHPFFSYLPYETQLLLKLAP